MARRYSEEEMAFLRSIAPGRYSDEITKMFNERFRAQKSRTAIRSVLYKNGIRSGVSGPRSQYAEEHINYLRKLAAKGLPNPEITRRFNERFRLAKTENSIQILRCKYKIKTRSGGRFNKGSTPWNKGLKGWVAPGAERTWFKKGNRPQTWMPVGTERVRTPHKGRTTAGDYIDVKVSEPNKWKLKHHLVWEAHWGPIPKGHAVIFGDGDNRNFDPENLICVSRKQLAMLNLRGLIKNHADLTRVGVMIADLSAQVNARKKNLEGGLSTDDSHAAGLGETPQEVVDVPGDSQTRGSR